LINKEKKKKEEKK